MKKIILKDKFLLSFAIRLVLFIVYLFSFTYGRSFITLLFFILGIVDVFMKKPVRVFIDLSAAFILYILSNPALDFYYQIEGLRFHILENQYNQTVEKKIPNFVECTELNYQDIDSSLLCDDSKIFYQKKDNSVLALFTTGNYGNLTGYIYCSDENAWKMAEQYDFYSKINNHWGVFKMYPLKAV